MPEKVKKEIFQLLLYERKVRKENDTDNVVVSKNKPILQKFKWVLFFINFIYFKAIESENIFRKIFMKFS